jgi:hypothetical protein
MRIRQLVSDVRRPSGAMAVMLSGTLLAIVGCGETSPRSSGEGHLQVSVEEQVRAVANTVLQAYVDEDYSRLCTQFAPGTFAELLAVTKAASCEELFSNAPTFEAPSPQQVKDTEVRIRGDHAKIVFTQTAWPDAPGEDPWPPVARRQGRMTTP